MKYKIRYNYNTGDSFHTENNIIKELEFTWSDYDVAKANLNRIKEHYEWYQSKKSSLKDEIDPTGKDWYSGKRWDHVLYLYTDDGTKCQISAPWVGWFETLNEAEIVIVGDKISFNHWD